MGQMERTIVIVDLAHHGTTMVAGICQILGVPMVGAGYDAEKWEDPEKRSALRKDQEAFGVIVCQRNAQHDTWGFKSVGAWKQAASLKTYLRNPVYLAIYKDIVSVTVRRFGGVTVNKLLNTALQMKTSLDGIQACGLPVRLLSYHRAIISPVEFVQGLAGRIGIEANSVQVDRAAAYIQPNRGSQKDRYPEVEPWV